MSPCETRDVSLEPEGMATCDSHLILSSCVKGDLAHASRGRPSPPRLPERTRARILELAWASRPSPLRESSVRVEGPSVGRQTSAAYGARPESAPLTSVAPPPIASAVSCALAEGDMLPLNAPVPHGLEDHRLQLTRLGSLDDASCNFLCCRGFYHRTRVCSRDFKFNVMCDIQRAMQASHRTK
jgi:hypothetical protein